MLGSEYTNANAHAAPRPPHALARIGRYEVLAHLASGRVGHVYLARAPGVGEFERTVVIKTLESYDDAVVAMFLDEARLVGALHHQHITPIHEVGCDATGRHFLVRDYIRGETAETVWRALCERGEPAPLAFTLTVVSAVASALEYAHTRCGRPFDIDVSLSNVMIGRDGTVKLIDLGRAARDHGTDVFALGIVLHELTTMTRAYRTPPSRIVAGYPRDLELVVTRALDVDPARRFADAGALARELEALARRLGLSLGQAAITTVMDQLADPLAPRFARSTSEIVIDVESLDDDDDTAPIAKAPPPFAFAACEPPTEITDPPTAPLGKREPIVPRAFAQAMIAYAIRGQRPAARAAWSTWSWLICGALVGAAAAAAILALR
jgi:serine/threonine protein kinase